MSRGLGWRPDLPDERDRLFAARPRTTARAQENRMDERVLRVLDQGATSSCVGHAAVGALELRRALDWQADVPLSPLGCYWHARAIDGYQDEDAGAHIRSAMKVIRKVGVPTAARWPFEIEKVNTRPDIEAEMSGITYADGSYERIYGGAERLLDALEIGPVVLGADITSAFMRCNSDATIPPPSPDDTIVGGHAFVACGYADHGQRIRILNSWGTGWGSEGKAWMDRAWIDSPNVRDLWLLRPSLEEDLNA